MSKMIQVRNVPDRLHRELVRRARAKGQTLTEYIERILEREVSRPSLDQLLARIASREPVKLDRPVSDYIDMEWEERDKRWDRFQKRRRKG